MQFLRTRPEVGSLLLCALLQIASAWWVVEDFESPNAASRIALSLVDSDRYAGDAWPLYSHLIEPEETRRLFHLPGEVLYLMSAFDVVPMTLWRFLHVPVVMALVGAIVFCTRCLLGIRTAWVVGVLACLHPFFVVHGPVWDDTFLAAALDWWIVAGLLHLLRSGNRSDRLWRWSAVLGAVAAVAAVTRLQSTLALGGFASLALLLPTLRPLRVPLSMILFGIAIGLGSWTWRNHAITGEWIAGSSHDGITLWESNYPHAHESILATGQVSDLNHLYMQEEFAATASLREWEADRYFRQRALAYMASHWQQVLRFGAVKLGVTLAGIAPSEPFGTLRNSVALITNLLFVLAVLYALTQLDWRHWPAEKMCFTFFALVALGSFAVLAMIGPIGWRYRIEIEGLLLMSAGLLLTRQSVAPVKKSGWPGGFPR